MKRRLSSLFIAALLLLGGCSKSDSSPFFKASDRLKVLSTTAMIDDLVGRIGGEEVIHTSLIMGDLDPHSYELVKGDDEKFLVADLIFSNGLGLEHGMSVKQQLSKHVAAVALGDLIYAKKPEAFISIDGQLDPHFWMDISLFAEVVDPIVAHLSERDPPHASLYHARGEQLKREMEEKDHTLLAKMAQLPPEKRYLVSSHDAFFYFTRHYLALPDGADWRERFIAPEGLAPDGQMTLRAIQEVSDFLCATRASVVFPESNVSRDGLKKIVSICKERGLEVKIASKPLYGDAMGAAGSGADTYLSMIEHNVQLFCEENQYR